MSGLACGKILGTQELGYRKGVPRGGGPYILISKKFIHMFPSLSKNLRNDRCFIDVVYNDEVDKATCAYIYHNDKHIDNPQSGRDEYRLYLNKSIHPEESVFKPGDLVFFRKIENDSNEPLIHITHFPEYNPSELAKIAQPMSKDSRNKNFMVESSYLPRLPSFKDLNTVSRIDPTLSTHTSSGGGRKGTEMSQSQFRSFLLNMYENKCAISSETIAYESLNACEAAHIQPDAHKGPMMPDNGILLSRDLHWAFDNGMFTIEDDGTIVVHDEMKHNDELAQYDGQQIREPIDVFKSLAPRSDYLRWHRNHFFGKFLRAQAR
jgi:hypothetical protein